MEGSYEEVDFVWYVINPGNSLTQNNSETMHSMTFSKGLDMFLREEKKIHTYDHYIWLQKASLADCVPDQPGQENFPSLTHPDWQTELTVCSQGNNHLVGPYQS